MKVSKEAGSTTIRIGEVFRKPLPVTLSDAERVAKASEMAQAQVQLMALEAEKKRINTELGEKMKPLKERVGALAPVVDTGVEKRPVEVQWEGDMGGTSAVLRRLDTGEVLEETRRALEADELQLSLGLQAEDTAGGELPQATPEFHSELAPVLRLVKPEGEERRGTYDYRKDPPHANRGTQLCTDEESHVWCLPDADGWEACKNCPAARRLVKPTAQEPDLDESRAALEDMDLQAGGPALSDEEARKIVADEVRWPLGAGTDSWAMSVRGEDMIFHSPDLPGVPAAEHGPARWHPEKEGAGRIIPMNHAQGWPSVPQEVLTTAAELIAMGRLPYAAGFTAEPEAKGDPIISLTELASRFLVALLPGPMKLDAIRAKTSNHRPGTTAKDLIKKGLVESLDGEAYALTDAGRKVATNLHDEKGRV